MFVSESANATRGTREATPTDRCGLIVERNPLHRLILARMLALRGYSLESAESDTQALSAWSKAAFGIILLDCDSEHPDAFALCKRLRAEEGVSRHTPIVAMTSRVLDTDRKKRKAVGFDNYVQKPVSATRLDAILTRYAPTRTQERAAHPTCLDPMRLAELWELTMGETAVFRDIVDAFLRDVPGRLNLLRRAEEDGCQRILLHAACSLKTMSGQIGAVRMEEIAATIEALASAGALGGTAALIAELALAFERAACDLRSAEIDYLSTAREPNSQHGWEDSARLFPRTFRVLLADNDALVAGFLKTSLSNAGFDVGTVAEGGAALAELRSGAWDGAILADLHGTTGNEVLAALRLEERTRNLPVLIVSPKSQDHDILRSFELGADDVVTKPFNPLEVAARMRRFLKRR